jgi:hypothetical protein
VHADDSDPESEEINRYDLDFFLGASALKAIDITIIRMPIITPFFLMKLKAASFVTIVRINPEQTPTVVHHDDDHCK